MLPLAFSKLRRIRILRLDSLSELLPRWVLRTRHRPTHARRRNQGPSESEKAMDGQFGDLRAWGWPFKLISPGRFFKRLKTPVVAAGAYKVKNRLKHVLKRIFGILGTRRQANFEAMRPGLGTCAVARRARETMPPVAPRPSAQGARRH